MSQNGKSSNRQHTGGDTLPVFLGVYNYSALVDCYGEEFAGKVLDDLCSRIADILGSAGVGDGWDDLRPAMMFGVAAEALLVAVVGEPIVVNGAVQEEAIEALLVAAARRPIVVNRIAVLVSLGVVPAPALARYMASPAREMRISNALYRQSMQDAVAAFASYGEGRLTLLCQDVRGIEDRAILYSECLARVQPGGAGGLAVPPAAFIPSIERLGLSRLFDRRIVLETLSVLRLHRGRNFGCNISAQSAVDDPYWASVFAVLKAEPDLARRLVIEITETAPIADLVAAREFVARLQSLGCRIAIDDFGVGHNTLRQTVALCPDIIKIDSAFLRDTALELLDAGFLAHVVGLSVSLGAQVILEGVEDERDLELAQLTGARWVQGYHIARPSALPKDASRSTPAAPLRGDVSKSAPLTLKGDR